MSEDPKARFYDYTPFRPPANEAEREWLRKRDEALRTYDATGDPTLAQKIGLFPTEEEKRLLAEEDERERAEQTGEGR